MAIPVIIPVFDVEIYLFYDKETAAGFIRDKAPNDDELKSIDRCTGMSHELDGDDGFTYRMLCVFDGERSTVIHESVHMAWFVLHHCGMKVARDNHEVLAYLTAWIADCAMTGLDTQKPPIEGAQCGPK